MRRFFLGVLALVGCNVDESGLMPPTSNVDGGADAAVDVVNETSSETSAPDVAIDSPPPPPQPCTTPPGACVAALPPGWTLLAFDATGSATCPSNFTGASVVSSPQAQSGACDCSCAVTSSPACDVGSLQRYVSNDSSCGTTGVSLNVNGPGCTAYPNTVLDNHSKSSPLAPSGGTCAGTPVTNTSDVTTTTGHSCGVPTACEEDFCGGSVPTGFKECIVQSGQQTCPSGWGTSPVVVGDAPTLACSACTCDLNGTTCTSASLDIFSDNQCNTKLVTMPVDGNCDVDSAAGSTPKAFKYHATLATQCNASGPKTATVGLTNARTICCKP